MLFKVIMIQNTHAKVSQYKYNLRKYNERIANNNSLC